MKQIAAILMFAAWLLYGAMPAMAMPSMPHPMSGEMDMSTSMTAMQDHAQHTDKMANAASSHVHGDVDQRCPHGGKACVAPFCSACLVVLPEMAFADNGRFIHRYPAPERGLSLVTSGMAPLTPPPRA